MYHSIESRSPCEFPKRGSALLLIRARWGPHRREADQPKGDARSSFSKLGAGRLRVPHLALKRPTLGAFLRIYGLCPTVPLTPLRLFPLREGVNASSGRNKSLPQPSTTASPQTLPYWYAIATPQATMPCEMPSGELVALCIVGL